MPVQSIAEGAMNAAPISWRLRGEEDLVDNPQPGFGHEGCHKHSEPGCTLKAGSTTEKHE